MLRYGFVLAASAALACGSVNVDPDAGPADSAVSAADANATDAAPGTHALTVTLAGTGDGGVTSSPAGIDCGTDCAEDYAEDTVVTLTATATGSSSFGGWSGACSGTGTCSVTMDAAKSVTASFNPPGSYTLSVALAGNGSGTVTSSPAGIDCGTTCSMEYVENTSVTLTAAPGTGATFDGWSGAGCAGTGGCTVTVTAATSVTATFKLDEHTLSVATAGTGDGTVTSSPTGIDCGTDCSEAFDYGTSVTLTAQPDANSTFASWSGACSGAGACVVDMTAAAAVTATFDTMGVVAARVVTDSPTRVCTNGSVAVTCPAGGAYAGQDGNYLINVPVRSVGITGALHDRTTDLFWELDEKADVTHAQAIAHCAAQASGTFAGRTDWRVPTYHELTTIVDVGKGTHIFYPEFLAYAGNSFFWTNATVGSSAFAISGNWATMSLRPPATAYSVRCVSGAAHAENFVISRGNTTVVDYVTGLEWQRASSPNLLSWTGALAYCEGLTLGGETDWRLPNLKELFSIVDPADATPPAISVEFTGTASGFYWSSSPLGPVGNPSRFDAYAVSFANGTSNLGALLSTTYDVRCVRGTP